MDGLVLNPKLAADTSRVSLDWPHSDHTERYPGVLTSGPVMAMPSPAHGVDACCGKRTNNYQQKTQNDKMANNELTEVLVTVGLIQGMIISLLFFVIAVLAQHNFAYALVASGS